VSGEGDRFDVHALCRCSVHNITLVCAAALIPSKAYSRIGGCCSNVGGCNRSGTGAQLKTSASQPHRHRARAKTEMEAILADAQQLLVDERFSEYVSESN
jgi:hypothetical protein